MIHDWTPPPGFARIATIDAHTAGEPLRIVIDGVGPIPGATILEKRRFARERIDDLRRALMWEPRGHADMYGAIITEPVLEGSDVGVLFLHNGGFSTMCGHGVIALVTALVETGHLAKSEESPSTGEESPTIRIDTPAGLVVARAACDGGRVRSVSFENVPSFLFARDRSVDVPGIGPVRYDVAFGGAFYAIFDSADLGVGLGPAEAGAHIELGRRLKRAVQDDLVIEHPFEKDLAFLYGTIVTGPPEDPAHHSRNVCVFADGEVDRSPTGTGVSARAALLHARGEIALGERFTVESILGTCMTGRALESTRFGPHAAVIPEVAGSAHLVGRSEWWIDPDDPLRHGFLLR